MRRTGFFPLVIGVFLIACQPAAGEPAAAVTVVSLANSTPEPTFPPTETAAARTPIGERKHVGGFFSFITPLNYHADLEEKAVFISDVGQEVFLSLAVIGADEDERTAQSLLEDIFAIFEGVEVQADTKTKVSGMTGTRADFSGVLSGSVISGNYVVIDLGEEVSFLAFGFGNVTAEYDRWEEYGLMNFAELLASVEIPFGAPF